jgi:hypothetical protein
MKINPKDFFEKYKLVGSVDLYESLNPLRCRFCGESSPDYFVTKSHLIPELLGENNHIAKDECDKCNTYFSKYESQLAIMARPFLTITNTKTKNKTPTFQSRSDFENQERTTVKVDKITLQRQVKANYKDVSIDKENNRHEITFRNPGFRPIDVYKALSKIILGIMPIDLVHKNPAFFNWILGKEELIEIGHGFQTKLLTKYFTCPSAMLYQVNQNVIEGKEYPEFVGIVNFANTVVQFYLPLTKRFKEKEQINFEICIFPAFAYDDITDIKNITITHMNLTQNEIYKHDETFIFKENKSNPS